MNKLKNTSKPNEEFATSASTMDIENNNTSLAGTESRNSETAIPMDILDSVNNNDVIIRTTTNINPSNCVVEVGLVDAVLPDIVTREDLVSVLSHCAKPKGGGHRSAMLGMCLHKAIWQLQ